MQKDGNRALWWLIYAGTIMVVLYFGFFETMDVAEKKRGVILQSQQQINDLIFVDQLKEANAFNDAEAIMFKDEADFSKTMRGLVQKSDLSLKNEKFSQEGGPNYTANIMGGFTQLGNFLVSLDKSRKAMSVVRYDLRVAGKFHRLQIEIKYLLQ